MASYAALLSLFHTLNHIKIHPRPPISLDQQHLHSLTQNLTFLLDFLERFSSKEDDELESRIAAAAYAAEDVIETHIVDNIHDGQNIRSVDLHQGLERVIRDMDLIKKEAMDIMIKEEKMKGSQHLQHLHTNSSASTASVGQSSTMGPFDDVLVNKVLDKLTGHQCSLQIIPMVGMGGIGKTTLARHIYSHPLIVQHFDILAWVTVSQEYSRRNILQVLCEGVKGNIFGLSEKSEDEIGQILYQHLFGRRYLIVIDDIWSIEAWNQVKCFFPNRDDMSRIMMTTRLSNLAFELSGSHDFHMQFLDEDKSWDLLCKIVFGKLDCPVELEDVGKEIARKCRGLPLSIVVIGGLLAKSNATRVYWEYSLHNLNSLINLEDNEYCMQVLRTSYKELPIHLKPCFLYMGIFPEDYEINVSKLIRLWVSEGILKPNGDKSLEEVAKEYLKELIERNLILIHELRWNGEAKICKIHDLLRNVCWREAEKNKFLRVISEQEHHAPQNIDMERRICINHGNPTEEFYPEFLHVVESASLTRSLHYNMSPSDIARSPSLHLRLLRVYSSLVNNYYAHTHRENAIFERVNLRYLSLKSNITSNWHSLCSLHWNLQTLHELNLFFSRVMKSPKIWEMPLLRHVKLSRFKLPNPPDGEHSFILENLQTISYVQDLKLSEEVVKNIPNVKKLKAVYKDRCDENTGFNYLCRLQKLESLALVFRSRRNCDVEIVQRDLVSFPHSLKKLSLAGTRLSWEVLNIRIGSLPLLQCLKLYGNACSGPKWETVEGQFCRLRVLDIYLYGLEYWDTDSDHFPLLEHLCLHSVPKLEEIPSCIGDIPTLKSIQLFYCTKSIVDSAKRIKEEQEENDNEDLQVKFGIECVYKDIESDSDEEDEVDSDEGDT